MPEDTTMVINYAPAMNDKRNWKEAAAEESISRLPCWP